MIIEARRLADRTKPKPMETMHTYQLRWTLTALNPVGQGIQCGAFRGRSISSTGAARIQGHNGEDCSAEEMWFDLLILDKPGLQVIHTPTAWIRPIAKAGAIVTLFMNIG